MAHLVLVMLLDLLDEDRPLLVLAPLVLEPDADHPGTQSGHLDQLVLHESVRSGVGSVAGSQGVQLFLVENGSHAGRLLVRLVEP